MSISSELLLINSNKQNIKQAINDQDVTVTNEAFAVYPDKVRLIQSGTGTYDSTIILYAENRLRNVVIPAYTSSIGDYAFYSYDANDTSNNLRTVSMPNTVSSIGRYAFAWNESLTTINLSTNLSDINESAFIHCHSLQSITLPSSMMFLGNNAFYECNDLSSVTLNEGLETIGGGAFTRCYPLASITIPSTVTSIGYGAFLGCGSLEYIISLPTVPPTLGTDAFTATNNCPIYVPDNNLLDYQVAWADYVDRIRGISEM